MKRHIIVTAGAALLALAVVNPTHAQTKSEYETLKHRVAELEAVVNKLEKNDAAQSAASSTVSKIKLSDSLTELKLYGDLRFRYQYDQADQQLNAPGSTPTLPSGLAGSPAPF